MITVGDVVKINNCVETNAKALEINGALTSPMTQYELCASYWQDTLACYPCCYCKESEYAATRAEVERGRPISSSDWPSRRARFQSCGKQHKVQLV